MAGWVAVCPETGIASSMAHATEAFEIMAQLYHTAGKLPYACRHSDLRQGSRRQKGHLAPAPAAATLIDGGLAQDVAGLGGYAMWDNHLYGAATVYRSEHLGGPQPNPGTGAGVNLRGVAPYWRVAWQQTQGNNYLEVGSFGMHAASTPNAVTGPTDYFTDVAADFQYERILPTLANDLVVVHGTYIHESSELLGTLAASGAAFPNHTLNTARMDAVYHFGNKYAATFGVFSTTGTTDPVLYSQADRGQANRFRSDASARRRKRRCRRRCGWERNRRRSACRRARFSARTEPSSARGRARNMG